MDAEAVAAEVATVVVDLHTVVAEVMAAVATVLHEEAVTVAATDRGVLVTVHTKSRAKNKTDHIQSVLLL